MQFVLLGEQKTTLLQIARGLKKNDPTYRFESGEYLLHGSDLIGQVEIYCLGDELFQDQLEWLRYRANSREGAEKESVLLILENASGILFFHIIQETLSGEQAVSLLQPLWDWLFANRKGLLYIDAEGFWDAEVLLLPDPFGIVG